MRSVAAQTVVVGQGEKKNDTTAVDRIEAKKRAAEAEKIDKLIVAAPGNE